MKGGRRRITEADFQVEIGDAISSHPTIEKRESEFMTGLFIRLPVSQREWIEEAAANEGVSLAEFVREALRLRAEHNPAKKGDPHKS